MGRRADVVEIFPNDRSAIHLAGALLIEQYDQWLVSRRYLSEESLALLTDERRGPDPSECRHFVGNWPREREQEKGVDVHLAIDLVAGAVRHEYVIACPKFGR